MILLRSLAAGAAFLFCLLLGAAGGLLVEARTASTRTIGGMVEITLYSVGGLTFGIWVGIVVGMLLGGLVAYQVWRLLGGRSHEGRD